MNESDLRQAFGQTIAAETPPPLALDARAMVGRARRARRRRVGLAAAALTLVAGTVAGVVVAVSAAGAGSGGSAPMAGNSPTCAAAVVDHQAGRPAAAPTSPAPPAVPQCAVESPNTQPVWPSGQSDRTARSGPHAQRAQKLLDALIAAAPAAYHTSDPRQQGQVESQTGSAAVWEYVASASVGRSGRTGVLLVREVTGDHGSTDLCTQAAYFYGSPAPGCHLVTVAGEQVAIAHHPTETRNVGYGPELDQWAVYRHPDGTLVWVAQAKSLAGRGPGLQQPLFTERQLATLATDPRFAG